MFNGNSRRPTRGQALAEFALVTPILLILLLGVADLGRLYASMIAVETAAREAADLGAFDPGNWNAALSPTNPDQTVIKMEQAACSSAAQSHLEGYAEPTGTVNHTVCTNPSMACTLEQQGQSPVDCASYTGGAGGCGDTATNPPCIVHVALTYQFDTLAHVPFLPTFLTFTRDARYAVSGLSTGAP